MLTSRFPELAAGASGFKATSWGSAPRGCPSAGRDSLGDGRASEPDRAAPARRLKRQAQPQGRAAPGPRPRPAITLPAPGQDTRWP